MSATGGNIIDIARNRQLAECRARQILGDAVVPELAGPAAVTAVPDYVPEEATQSWHAVTSD